MTQILILKALHFLAKFEKQVKNDVQNLQDFIISAPNKAKRLILGYVLQLRIDYQLAKKESILRFLPFSIRSSNSGSIEF